MTNAKSSIVLLSVLLAGCSSIGKSADVANSCRVPSMYQSFDVGLVEPTWEPKEKMMEQLPASDRHAKICWYGYPDGRIEARVNPTERGYKGHSFRLQSHGWTLVDSYEQIVVH
jgi:hypothetical protein